MTTWESVAPDLVAGGQLTYDAACDLMGQIMDGDLGEVRLASFLSLLAMRGVGTNELHGLADAMRDRARPVSLPSNVVDIVGTGGDQAHTVNISTMAAIVIAAVGVPVVKHGNRASTSSSGSADVLEALGVNLQTTPKQLAESFSKARIAFLFANNYHPSMRHAAAVRQALAFPTVFNVLGPLTNPARPEASAIGVANLDLAPLVAGVFARRGNRALIFRGTERGLDELSTIEPAAIWEVRGGETQKQIVDPAEILGVSRSVLDDIVGGDPSENAKAALDVFGGATGPVSDAVVINAAAGIVAYEHNAEGKTLVERLTDAATRARAAITEGKALETLHTWAKLSSEDIRPE
jgi:anthranilate phosphoribosyltransferase